MTRRASGCALVASLLLDEGVDDQSDEYDVDCPPVRSLPENPLQSIPDGIEVEDDEQKRDEERNPHPRLELKGLAFFHVRSPFQVRGFSIVSEEFEFYNTLKSFNCKGFSHHIFLRSRSGDFWVSDTMKI